jgi:hypothetical protein
VYPSTSLRKERLYLPLSTRSSSPHPHDAQPILPQGRQAKGGLYLKQKRPVKRMAKDYYLPKTSHHTQKSEAKGRGASIPQTFPVYRRLPQSDR